MLFITLARASGEGTLLKSLVHWAAVVIEVGGVLIVVIGMAIATGFFLRGLFGAGWSNDLYRHYRASLGRSILLGLEFLVGADIIRTVAIDPSLTSAGVLGLIVLIRTALSFALEAEIEGNWPWRRTELRGPEEHPMATPVKTA